MPNDPDELTEYRLDQLDDLKIGSRLTALETEMEDVKKLGKKIDGIRGWLMTVAGGLIVSLILLVFNLVVGHKPTP